MRRVALPGRRASCLMVLVFSGLLQAIAAPVARADARADMGASAPGDAAAKVASPRSSDPLAGLHIHAELISTDAPFTVGAVRTVGSRVQVRLSAPDLDPVWAAPGHRLANGWQLVDVEPDAAVFLSPRGVAVRMPAAAWSAAHDD